MKPIPTPGLLSVLPMAPAYRRIGWLFTLAWGAFVIFRRLLREGMWADGLTYAAISRNMAIGKGSFWSPVFASSFWLPYNQTETFYEHPPLLFYIQSWFFRLLGDTYVTERVYCFLVIILILILMVQLWWQMVPAVHPLHRWEWLPVFILFTCPLTEWTYAQNYLDATMSLFCLLTVKYTMVGWHMPKKSFLMAPLAAMSLLAAFLTKGPVSLHVLAVPALLGVVYYRPAQIAPAVRWTLMLSVGFGGLLGLLLLYEPARIFLHSYFNQQVWAALNSKRELLPTTAGSLGRAFILKIVGINIAPGLVLMAVLWIINRFWLRSAVSVRPLSGMSRFYAGLGLAATVPMMATTKQFDYYVVPALPYLSLGLAAWLGPQLLKTVQTIALDRRGVRAIMAVGVVACLVTGLYGFTIAGKPYHSYRQMLSDVGKIGAMVPSGSQLGACPEVMADPLLNAYVQRYFRIELTSLAKKPDYFLTNPQCQAAQEQPLAQVHYTPVGVSLSRYFMYRRSNAGIGTKRL
ncbi:hypothetical protein GCM10027299_33780 [Larkinella ripae]